MRVLIIMKVSFRIFRKNSKKKFKLIFNFIFRKKSNASQSHSHSNSLTDGNAAKLLHRSLIEREYQHRREKDRSKCLKCMIL
jgi:hypothetical protein